MLKKKSGSLSAGKTAAFGKKYQCWGEKNQHVAVGLWGCGAAGRKRNHAGQSGGFKDLI